MFASVVLNCAALDQQKLDILNLTPEQIDTYINPIPYLGFSFEMACQNNNLSVNQKECVKARCFSFLKKLLKELLQRLPSNLNIFKNIQLFSVNNCLKPNKDCITPVAAEFYKEPATITKIEFQWNNLTNIHWQNTHNTEAFWSEVFQYRDASNNNPFEELCNLALYILTLPHSNAHVERVFSAMALVKCKLRNRMCLSTLDNILRIRFGLRRNNVCCQNYEIPNAILQKVGTVAVYQIQNTENDDLLNILDVLDTD